MTARTHRLRAVVVLLALACRPRPDALQAEAEAALAAGRVASAREVVGRARSLVTTESADGWALRLLAAEIAIEADEVAAVRAARDNLDVPASAGKLEARRQRVLGQVKAKLQDRAAAESHLRRARELAGEDRRLPIEIDLALGALLSSTGRLVDAEAASSRASKGAAELGDARLKAMALNQLGYLALAAHHYDQALLFLDSALAEARAAGAESVAARVQLNRGICLGFLGHFELGLATLQEAAATRERLGLWAPLRNVLGSLGNNHWLRFEYGKALPFYVRALEISRQHAPESIKLWARNLAATYLKLERWDDAERANEEARRQPGGSDEDEAFIAIHTANIAAARGDHARAEKTLRELLARKPRGLAGWVAHSALAADLYQQHRDADADPQYLAVQELIAEARAAIKGPGDQIAFFSPLLRLHQQYVESLIRRKRVAAALEASESFRVWVLLQRLGQSDRTYAVTAAELVERLARDEALVSYFVAPARSTAWVVTRRGIQLVELAGQARLDAAVEAHRAAIERGDPGTDASSRTLYELVVAPLAPHLAGVTEVVVAPDGPLFGVPFAALVVPGERPHFWIDDVQLSVVPSLKMLPAEAPRGEPPRKTLAFAAPVVDDPQWGPLPHAEEEAAALKRHVGAEVVTGPAARPEAYLRRDLSDIDVLHFAAHAQPNPVEPLEASIVLSRGALGGRLSVRDVLTVPLAANLVTLSACRSAGNRIYGGEGLLGLAWGFLTAGARAVVAGLWDVPDRSTAALMDAFYAELARGSPPAAALRAAQLGLARSSGPWRRPYYWAAFSVYLGPGRDSSARP